MIKSLNQYQTFFTVSSFFTLEAVLYYALKNITAVFIVLAGVLFFYGTWQFLKNQFASYQNSITLSNKVGDDFSKTTYHYTIFAMIVMTIILAILLGNMAFKGVEDSRMIWAFHEDEGWIADLYEEYVNQENMNLGQNWGYTYGSFNLMTVSIIARILKPVIYLDGADCVVLNRLLLALAFLVTGWVVFQMGVKFLHSPMIGVVSAGLLWTNGKIIEISLPANYPDTFGMLFFTLTIYFGIRMLVDMKPLTLFLAPLFLGIGFSVKYMGLPLILLLLISFRLAQGRVAFKYSTTKLRFDLFFYTVYIALALPIAFFTINPYYIINWERFNSQMTKVIALYGSGNINNLPASGINLPTFSDWWVVIGSGGAPDHILIMYMITCLITFLFLVFLGKERWNHQTVMLALGGSFIVFWMIFVLLNTKFAFFHYFLPIMPVVYLIACTLPQYIRKFIPVARLRYTTVYILSGILVVSISVSVLQDFLRSQDWTKSELGYASRDSLKQSRFGLSFQMLTSLRTTEGNIAFEVGDWLQKYTPDARSLITNETIFYYPHFIKEIHYWNRQMTLELLLKTAPDLLIVSDWFIEMYTKPYNQEEIDNMSPDERTAFLKAREFYSLLRDKDSFLSYKKIKEFKAWEEWYWKRLHIYKRIEIIPEN